jgi:hypothetical protein
VYGVNAGVFMVLVCAFIVITSGVETLAPPGPPLASGDVSCADYPPARG